MNQEAVTKMYETIAKIFEQRENVKITVKVAKKEK